MDQADVISAKMELNQFEAKRRLREEAMGRRIYALPIFLGLLVLVQVAIIGFDQIKFGRAPSAFSVFEMAAVLIIAFNYRTQKRLDAIAKLITTDKS